MHTRIASSKRTFQHTLACAYALGGVDGRVRLIVVPPRPRLAPKGAVQDASSVTAPASVLRHAKQHVNTGNIWKYIT